MINHATDARQYKADSEIYHHSVGTIYLMWWRVILVNSIVIIIACLSLSCKDYSDYVADKTPF
jgi:hypothetical protein